MFLSSIKVNTKPRLDDIIKLSVEKIYNAEEVIDKEISGFEILNELLEQVYFSSEQQLHDNTRPLVMINSFLKASYQMRLDFLDNDSLYTTSDERLLFCFVVF